MKTRAVIDVAAVATVPKPTLRPIEYDVTEAEIALFREKYAGIAFDTPEGYEAGRVALGELRTKRTAVEKRRKDLKAESLTYGRAVDDAARQWTTLIAGIEDPLQAAKDAVDEAKENAKRAAEKADLLALEAKIKAEQEAEAAKLEADRKAHEEQRAAFAAQQAEADRKRAEEQAALDAQRAEVEAAQRVLDEQRAAAAREEEERQAAIQRESEARIAADLARAEAEQAAVRAAEEAARLEALRPDVEKVRGWAMAIRDFGNEPPDVASPEARRAISWIQGRLNDLADKVQTFEP